MAETVSWSLGTSIALFVAAAAVIALTGVGISSVADVLADRLRLGEALVGGVFVGAATSLSGAATTVTAAWDAHPTLAVSNALGGIAIQTAFLPLADLVYRRANLEHAAASAPNLLYVSLLMVLLGLPLLARLSPPVTLWGVSPASWVIPGVYLYGLYLVRATQQHPMWLPRRTLDTRLDVPRAESMQRGLPGLLARFAVFAALVAAAGWVLARAAESIVAQTGLSEAVLGALFTAGATSLPEFVTSVAAVRQGALVLAVGNIIGGNAFDVLQLVLGDVAYRGGSIYHAAGEPEAFLLVLTLAMTGVLLLGLLHREQRGLANIGFEGVLILGIYLAGMARIVLA